MGIFDRFSRNTVSDDRNERNGYKGFGNFTITEAPKSEHGEAEELKRPSGNVAVYSPSSFKEVEDIISHLRENKPAIVYLNEIKESTAQRVLDLLSGAIFALKGGLYEIQPGIFIFTPDGVDVKLT